MLRRSVTVAWTSRQAAALPQAAPGPAVVRSITAAAEPPSPLAPQALTLAALERSP